MNVLIEKIRSLVQKEYIFLHERYTLFDEKIYSFRGEDILYFLNGYVFYLFMRLIKNRRMHGLPSLV